MWLRRLEPAIAASGAARERLERVQAAGGVLVTTGQQAGLFGGPLYTLTKAISALALADAIERDCGVAAAPLFWAATDDADFEEASSMVLAVDGGTETLRLTSVPPAGTPMSHAPLGDTSALIARLEDACGSAVAPEALALVRSAYGTAASIGDAYVRLLRGVLEPLGIGVLDASHPAVREAGEAVTKRALERSAAIEGALERRAREIADAGYRPQVEHVPGLSPVFITEGGGKRRLTTTEAAGAARSAATALSPNVLLRPILERAILPTVAYVAGPGELAYFAQVSAVAEAMEAAQPLALLRWSAMIVEPRVTRLLERLRVDMDDLRDPNAVETSLARAVLPRPVSDALRDLRRDVERGIAAIDTADEDDLVPRASLEGVRRWTMHRLDRLDRRYAAAVKRREVQLMRDVATARGALYPDGHPQERVLGFAPFVARYGRPLLEAMIAEARVHAGQLVDSRAAPALPEPGRASTRA